MICKGCKWYRPKGIDGMVQSRDGKAMERGGKYPRCDRPGAIPLAMEERKTGECGPDAKKREA